MNRVDVDAENVELLLELLFERHGVSDRSGRFALAKETLDLVRSFERGKRLKVSCVYTEQGKREFDKLGIPFDPLSEDDQS